MQTKINNEIKSLNEEIENLAKYKDISIEMEKEIGEIHISGSLATIDIKEIINNIRSMKMGLIKNYKDLKEYPLTVEQLEEVLIALDRIEKINTLKDILSSIKNGRNNFITIGSNDKDHHIIIDLHLKYGWELKSAIGVLSTDDIGSYTDYIHYILILK